MSMTNSIHAVVQNINPISNHLSRQPKKAINVYIRLMFIRIGEIDTLSEKYQAQASIEARWPVQFDNLSADLSPNNQKRLLDGKSVTLLKYNESHWYPQLYIENSLGDLNAQIRYSAKKSKVDNEFYVCEHRDIKGSFWEKLELQHFPADVQDLSISLATMLYDDKVVLVADPRCFSGVNREAFVDQQEWLLYEHVDIEQRYIKEFVFHGVSDDEDDDDDDNQMEDTDSKEGRKRSILTVTCHAARQSNYFYWNGYCLILLIALVSFCIFGLPTHLAANRLQISCILLLTSITFRWTVNRSLPTISYLTSLDIYDLMCIFNLVLHCIWHGIVGALTFAYASDFIAKPGFWLTTLDRWIFVAAVSIFITGHILFGIWLHLVPHKHRAKMQNKDIQYRLSMVEKMKLRKTSYCQIPKIIVHSNVRIRANNKNNMNEINL